MELFSYTLSQLARNKQHFLSNVCHIAGEKCYNAYMENGLDYAAVIEVVQEAGEILRRHFGKIPPVKNKGEFAVDVVTRLDMDVEQLLIKPPRKTPWL